MQIIEMYEPDEDLKKKGKERKKNFFFFAERYLPNLKILDF